MLYTQGFIHTRTPTERQEAFPETSSFFALSTALPPFPGTWLVFKVAERGLQGRDDGGAGGFACTWTGLFCLSVFGSSGVCLSVTETSARDG